MFLVQIQGPRVRPLKNKKYFSFILAAASLLFRSITYIFIFKSLHVSSITYFFIFKSLHVKKIKKYLSALMMKGNNGQTS